MKSKYSCTIVLIAHKKSFAVAPLHKHGSGLTWISFLTPNVSVYSIEAGRRAGRTDSHSHSEASDNKEKSRLAWPWEIKYLAIQCVECIGIVYIQLDDWRGGEVGGLEFSDRLVLFHFITVWMDFSLSFYVLIWFEDCNFYSNSIFGDFIGTFFFVLEDDVRSNESALKFVEFSAVLKLRTCWIAILRS